MTLAIAPDRFGLLSHSASIRRATIADIPELLQIERVFPTDRLTQTDFLASMARRDKAIFVATHADVTLGYALCQRRAWIGSMRLYSIATQRAFQSSGVGTLLLKAVEAFALAERMKRIHLEVRRDNPRARKFYFNHGYQKFGVYYRFYSDRADALRLCKRLA